MSGNRVITEIIGPNGLPLVVVKQHSNDTVEIPYTFLDNHNIRINTHVSHSNGECYEWHGATLESMLSFVASFKEVRDNFVKDAMSTGLYEKVDLVYDTDDNVLHPVYYSTPTIEEMVLIKELARQKIKECQHEINTYQQEVEKTKQLLFKLGEKIDE